MEKFDKLQRAKLSCKSCGEPLWYDSEGNYVCTCPQGHSITKSVPKAI